MFSRLLGIIILLPLVSSHLCGQPNIKGQWTNVIQMPIVPVGSANLPDGKVLTWSAYDRFTFGGDNGRTYTAIFDPATNQSQEMLIINTGHDMFCPGINNLADGRILVAGGSSSGRTSIYNPYIDKWTDGGNMNIPRGYQGNVTLSSGGAFTIGGSWSGGQGNKHAEVWTPQNQWQRLTGLDVTPILDGVSDPQGVYREDNHVWLWPAPNGKVFHAGPSANMHWIDTGGTGSYTNAGARGNDGYSMCGTTVMYDIGKILKAGGSSTYGSDTDANNRCFVIDINTDQAQVTDIPDMDYDRIFHSSVVLPTGEVLILGGADWARPFSDRGFQNNNIPEMYDPETNTWSKMAAMAVPRTYHSIGLLLNDGRVLMGGGGLCGGCTENGVPLNHPDVEIFSPPYLFDENGALAERPEISSAPVTADYLKPITVKTNCTISSFTLVRFSSATHGTNNEQRRIPLSFQNQGVNTYELNIPGRNLLPPGYYMLFAMNSSGVPSISKSILVGSATPLSEVEEEDTGDLNCDLSKDNWSLQFVDSQELDPNISSTEGDAVFAFDGNPASIWHTEYVSQIPAYPHEIQINLGSPINIGGFQYLPRQINGVNGTIKDYEFYISVDGTNWGSPISTGAFASNTDLKERDFTPVTGQYIRLRALSEINGNPWASAAEINVCRLESDVPCIISKDDWTLQFTDSQEPNGPPGEGAATFAFDNDPGTIWHTEYNAQDPPYPHEIQINLGDSYDIRGFQYLPRSGGGNGTIKDFEFYVSTDGVNWGTAVSTGSFASNGALKERTFTTITGQYIRLRGLSEINGNPWASAAEINVLSNDCNPDLTSQTITFNPISNKSVTDPSFTINATASSGLPVNFSMISGPAILDNNTVILTGLPGQVTIRAEQAGGNGYEAAPPLRQSFWVNDANCPIIDLATTTVNSYEPAQDNGIAEVSADGTTIHLSNNAWKSIDYSYTLTPNSMLAFEFLSDKEGEYHSIGMDNDNVWNEANSFKLYGTQDVSGDTEDYDNYGETGYQTYVIPIGTHYTGLMNHIFFLADHDAAPGDGTAYFRNIRVYEAGACNSVKQTQVQVKVFLQGPWGSGEMNTTLSVNNLVPNTQPYDDNPWNYAGEECLDIFPADCVDWVLVNLRDATDPTNVLFQRTCLLRKDGVLIDVDGSESINFGRTGLASGYISIHHRNHLSVMTQDPVVFD